MATKEQYEFFKLLFDEEAKRSKSLIDRGKTFISLVTLYSGLITLTIENDFKKDTLFIGFFSAAVAALLLSFLMSILAIGIYKYELINRPKDIIDKFGDDPPSNEDFFDHRIIDFAVACRRNSLRNDHRAGLLWWASIFLLIGLVLHGVYFFMKGLQPGGVV